MDKQDLGTFMKQKCATWHKEHPGERLTAYQLDRLMESWTNEYYNDGTRCTINTFTGAIQLTK